MIEKYLLNFQTHQFQRVFRPRIPSGFASKSKIAHYPKPEFSSTGIFGSNFNLDLLQSLQIFIIYNPIAFKKNRDENSTNWCVLFKTIRLVGCHVSSIWFKMGDNGRKLNWRWAGPMIFHLIKLWKESWKMSCLYTLFWKQLQRVTFKNI